MKVFRWTFKAPEIDEDEKAVINQRISAIRGSLWSLEAFGVEDEDTRQAYLNVLGQAMNDIGDLRHKIIEIGLVG